MRQRVSFSGKKYNRSDVVWMPSSLLCITSCGETSPPVDYCLRRADCSAQNLQDRQVDRQEERETDRWKDREENRQTGRWTDGQEDREVDELKQVE